MKVLFLTLFLVCHVFGRPSDPHPVTREFGVQPNNPNVKIFSTYPTLKPIAIARPDNPNDLEKADNEKLEKDENETTEFKGEELSKAENDDIDTKTNNTSEIKVSEDETEMNSTLPIEAEKKENIETTNAMDSMPKTLTSQSVDEEGAVNESSSDAVIVDESPMVEIQPISEVEAEYDMIAADPNPPIMDEPILPIAEPELISPIGIETPIDLLSPLSNDELEDEYVLNLPEIEDEEQIFGLGDQTPFLNSGVILPLFVPVEEVPLIDTHDDRIYAISEETTLAPIINEVSTNSTLDPVKPGMPDVEMPKENLEPMASLTDESVILDPVVETDAASSLPEQEGGMMDIVAETTESDMGMDMNPMEGDIGVSLPMNDNIQPLVEAEPDSMIQDMKPEKSTEESNTTELVDTPKEKYSLKITKTDQDEGATAEEIITEIPNQMAGFMSEEVQSSSVSSMSETTIPSTTELMFDLKITEPEEEPMQESNVTIIEPPTDIEPRDTVLIEPMDNLENVDNVEPSADKTMQSSTESAPTVNPMELTNEEEGNNDLTINETL